MQVFLFFLPNACLIPSGGALRLEALSCVYWESPSLDTLKVQEKDLWGFCVCSLDK